MNAEPIIEILKENAARRKRGEFRPLAGIGAPGARVAVEAEGLPSRLIPKPMAKHPEVAKIIKLKSLDQYLVELLGHAPSWNERNAMRQKLVRIRCAYDFTYWAAAFVKIKPKGGGQDIPFILNAPQRMLLEELERQRIAGKPIRVILLKARQWGGSTLVQIYMAWLQLIHKKGLNSLIIAHLSSASITIRSMFDRMLDAYPAFMLHRQGEEADEREVKMRGVPPSVSLRQIPARRCVISIGSAQTPDSARGGDYNLVHCSEVGLWKTTDGKKPEEIVRSACSGVLAAPYTLIVYESTANGVGNFFHAEWEAAKRGTSQFAPVFIPWHAIEWNTCDVPDEVGFARKLWENRGNVCAATDRQEPGAYLWQLWERGATLQGIAWYINERKKFRDHADMAAEAPSDDVEAFAFSGDRVFDRYQCEELRKTCRPPRLIGDLSAKGTKGEDALEDVRFAEDGQGSLWVWSPPEPDGEDEEIQGRYVAVVDIGGRSAKADWSVVCVFDRLPMIDGEGPLVVAQLYTHIDMDQLAWKAAQIARHYNNALLVIESNTLETKDPTRAVDGDLSGFILTQLRDCYPNLYARRQSAEDMRNHAPRKYGFHTNVSTKPMVIATLQQAIRERAYTERDERCVDEYLAYERKPNGSMGAVPGKHDDLLMTRAIGLHVCLNEMAPPTITARANPRQRKRTATTEATL